MRAVKTGFYRVLVKPVKLTGKSFIKFMKFLNLIKLKGLFNGGNTEF